MIVSEVCFCFARNIDATLVEIDIKYAFYGLKIHFYVRLVHVHGIVGLAHNLEIVISRKVAASRRDVILSTCQTFRD
jgi:hypothetical protein